MQQIHTVDIIIPRWRVSAFPDLEEQFELPLVRRLREGSAYYGYLALPGGKLDPDDQDLSNAVQRELREEIGLDLPLSSFLQIGTFAKAGRDPRPGRWISTLFIVPPLLPQTRIAGPQDKQECSVEWVTLGHARRIALAFDHNALLERGYQHLAGMLGQRAA